MIKSNGWISLIAVITAFFLLFCTMIMINTYLININTTESLKKKILQNTSKNDFEFLIKLGLGQYSIEKKQQIIKNNINSDSNSQYGEFLNYFQAKPTDLKKIIYDHEPIDYIAKLKQRGLSNEILEIRLTDYSKEHYFKLYITMLISNIENKYESIRDNLSYKISPYMNIENKEPEITVQKIIEKYE